MTKILNRRRFLESSSAACFLGAARTAPQKQVAYVGFGDGSESDGIHVYELGGRCWRLLQTVPSRKPASVVIHPKQPLLFAANDVEEHGGLPGATVEAFQIEPSTGHLRQVNQVSLSLSASRPRHLAIAQQTNHLVVASSQGGSYNVLAFDGSGQLAKPSHIRKETGCGAHPEFQSSSHPHSCLFDVAGNLLTSDLGGDRLSVFPFRDGKLTRAARTQSEAGDGPGPIVIDASGSVVYVLNVLGASVSQYEYSAQRGRVGREINRRRMSLPGSPANHGSLALCRDRLAASLNTGNESLFVSWSDKGLTTSIRSHAKAFYAVVAHPDSNSWLALDRPGGAINEIPLYGGGRPQQVAKVNKPLSLAFQLR